MRKAVSSIIAIAIGFLGADFSASAQEGGCVKSDCHQTIGTATWSHGPVGAGACTVCHAPVEGQDHQFRFAAEVTELCFFCHDESRGMMLEDHQHKPVAEGRCTDCHDPHASENRFMLKFQMDDLCYSCHDRHLFTGFSVHGPIKQDDCIACHDPHASAHPNQLLHDPSQICFQCHKDWENVKARHHPHTPVAVSCMKCHLTHTSENSFLLTRTVPELCFSCHSNIAEYAGANYQHSPVETGSCLECHEVHGTDLPRLMRAPLSDICFGCHTELADYIFDQEYRHGPVQDRDCIACHNPHGSNHHDILRKYFPEDFYVAYAEDNYAMCFECHNQQLVTAEETEKLTDFRHGKKNLHYVHVHKTKKGRSCRACHQAHASSQKKHIRLSVPYGAINWELPIKFMKTEFGGSCEVGCHSPKEYSRK